MGSQVSRGEEAGAGFVCESNFQKKAHTKEQRSKWNRVKEKLKIKSQTNGILCVGEKLKKNKKTELKFKG